jgi:competence protein ComEC
MDASGKAAKREQPTGAGTNGRSSPGSLSSARASPPYQPLVTVIFAVAAGIALDRYGRAALGDHFSAAEHAAFAVWWSFGACFLAVWWLAWRRRFDALAAGALLAAAALCGASWHDARWNYFDRWEVGRYAAYEPAPACVLAVARETPGRVPAPRPTPLRAIPGNERTRLDVELIAVRHGTAWRPAAGICQLTIEGHLLGVRAGDRLRIFGQLAKPSPPMNPGEFDFAAHGRADRRMSRLRSSAPECVSVMKRAQGGGAGGVLEAVRGGGRRMVRSYVGPDRAGLAGAILLGTREGLTAEDTLPYLLTGTIHVLVVSGLNVAILAMVLMGFMRVGLVSRRAGLAVVILVVVLYAMVAESQPPVVRAAVLAVLVCVAAWIGRRGVAFNSLAAAALIVLAMNPCDLFRPGPQLSFLAVATLIWVGDWARRRQLGPKDRLEEMQASLRPWYIRAGKGVMLGIVWILVTSLAVWLVTLPLVLHQFHVGSPVAVLISPAVWLAVAGAMWSGFVMLATGWLIPPLAAFCGAVCDASLGGLDRLVGWADSLPAGHFWAAGPAWWWVLGFYISLVVVMVRGGTVVLPRWQWAALGAWIVVGLAPSLVRPWARDGLECSFVAVGHGACVLLESPTGETVVYDAGGLGSPEYTTQTIAAYLWHRGIQRIDGMVISHADVDHYNAVPGLLERFRIGAVYVSPMMFEGIRAGSGPDLLHKAIRAAGVPIRDIWSGDRLRVGSELTLDVLHPPQRGVVGSDNANSVTLAVECGGRRVLLPGDLESPGLEDVMAELPYDCDVLLAPHHGSRRSDPPGFAAWSTPEWVVISGGRGDEVVPVVRTYESAGARVLRTDKQGAVRFTFEPRELKMAPWLVPGGADVRSSTTGVY